MAGATVRNINVRVGADISQFERNMRQAQRTMQNIGSSMTDIGKKLSLSITAPVVGLGIAAVKMAADFEQSMANAASVSGATAEEFEYMQKVAREMGATTAFAAKDAADAMYYMASAGWKANQMAEAIKPTLDLAAATQSELAFTTDVVISALNQFGLEAQSTKKVTNVFASAIGNSQATLDKLAYSMRYVGPVANSLGYSVEETTAALGLLYNAGFKGEQAGTILRGALSALLKPTKNVTSTLGDMGLAYAQVNPATNALADIIKVLGAKSITTSQAIQIFGQEAGPGMMSLISQGSSALLEMEEKITGTDAATEMAKRQLETLHGQFKILWSSVSEVAIQIGNTLIPILKDLVTKYVAPAVQWFSNLSESQKKLTLAFIGIAAAIGPVLIVVGTFLSSIGAISGMLPAIGAVLTALTGPVGLIVLGIAGITAAIIYLWKTNETFRTIVISAWDGIKTVALTIFGYLQNWWMQWGDTIINIFSNVWGIIKIYIAGVKLYITAVFKGLQIFWSIWGESLTKYWTGLWGIIKALLIGAFNGIKIYIETALKMIKEITQLALNILKGNWSGAWDNIKNIVKIAGEYVSKMFINWKDAWINIFSGVKTAIIGIFESLWVGIKIVLNVFAKGVIGIFQFLYDVIIGRSIIPDMVNAILNWFDKLFKIGRDIFKAIKTTLTDICNGIKTTLSTVWNSIIVMVDTTWDKIEDTIQTSINIARSIINTVMSLVKGDWQSAWNNITNILEAAWGTLSNSFANIKNQITTWFSNMVDSAVGFGKNVVEGMGKGINQMAGWIKEQVTGFCNSIGSSIKDFFGISSPSKLMEEYGDGISQGLADGIENNKAPINAIAAFVGTIKNQINEAVNEMQKLSNIGVKYDDENLQTIYDITGKTMTSSTLSSYMSQQQAFVDANKSAISEISKTQGVDMGVAADMFKNISGKIQNATKTVIGIMTGITQMASGGIVSRPTLALVGESGPEAVIPLNKNNSSRNVVINVTGNTISDRYDIHQIGKDLVRELKLQGVAI